MTRVTGTSAKNRRPRRFASGLLVVGLALGVLFLWLGSIGSAGASAGPSNCGTGNNLSGNSDILVANAPAGRVVDFVCIKSGSNMFGSEQHSERLFSDGIYGGESSPGCYSVSGLGTSQATVTRLGDGPACKALSHVDFGTEDGGETETPTATSTPTSGRQIVARAKCSPRSADDYHSGAVVRLEIVERIVELENELLRKRVHLFGPVQR